MLPNGHSFRGNHKSVNILKGRRALSKRSVVVDPSLRTRSAHEEAHEYPDRSSYMYTGKRIEKRKTGFTIARRLVFIKTLAILRRN